MPQASDFIDAQPLSKGKTEKAKKKKEAKKAKGAESEFMTSAAPEMYGVASPAPVDSARASPMPKAGFSRIGTVPAAGSGSAGHTPDPAERSKVAFGFGTKRKAVDEGAETPPSKRR